MSLHCQRIINLTPNHIRIFDSKGSMIDFTASLYQEAAQLQSMKIKEGKLMGCPFYSQTFGDVKNLPEPSDGTWFIVPLEVALLCSKSRTDLIVPSEVEKDYNGNIIGYSSFIQYR